MPLEENRVVHSAGDSLPNSSRKGREDFALEKHCLGKLLDSPEIARSASLVRFLSYICTKYFDGQAEEIREYAIAVEALGRREGTFDSRVDPIVRVTARSLRKKLAEYYAGEGASDPIRIVLPLGHYVPTFVPAEETLSNALSQETESDSEIDLAAESEEAFQAPDATSAESLLQPIAPAKATPATSVASSSAFLRFAASTAGKLLAAGLLLAAVFASGFFIGRERNSRAVVSDHPLSWGEPIWQDNFDGAANQLPDPAHWSYDAGGGGWGAKQEQFYCAPNSAHPCDPRHPNAFLDGSGHLVLRGQRGTDGTWTSARLTTRGLKEFQYGRIEIRLKMPVGKGLWPSIWMLGSNIQSTPWPDSGSFDFVENVALNSGSNGLGPSIIRSTIHGPHYYGANGLWHDFHLPNGARVDDGAFHTYGILWSPGMIQFYVDDPANIYFVANSSDIPEGSQWVFDHPFNLLMNLGIGGDWPGAPDATTPNPADMLVDYVRLYAIPHTPAPAIQWHATAITTGSTVASNVQLTAASYLGRVHLTCATEPATTSCSLATPIVNFADTLSQQDTITITTDSYTSTGRVTAPPGRYKLTLTATTISGDHSQLVVPFEVRAQ